MGKRFKIAVVFSTGLLGIISYFILNFFLIKGDFEGDRKRIQHHFLGLNEELSSFAGYIDGLLKNDAPSALWKREELIEHRFNVHVFQNDNLVYWNVNKLPIEQLLLAKELPSSGVYEFLNGLYLIKRIDINDVSLLISKQFVYSYGFENKNLQTKVNPKLGYPSYLKLTLNNEGVPILDKEGNPVFNLILNQYYSTAEWKEWLVFFALFIGVSLCLLSVVLFILWNKQLSNKWLLLVVLFSWGTYYYWTHQWNFLFEGFTISSSSRYASSEFFPNFLSLFVATGLIVLTAYLLNKTVLIKLTKIKNAVVHLFTYVFLLIVLSAFAWLIASLVANSTIHLQVDELFSLQFDAVLSLLIISGLFVAYYLLAQPILFALVRSSIPLNKIATGWFVISMLHFFMVEFLFVSWTNYAFWGFIINGFLIYSIARRKIVLNVGYNLIAIALFSAFAAYILFDQNNLNERQKIRLYANQLISDKDPTVELEYLKLRKCLEQNHDIRKLLSETTRTIEPKLFQDVFVSNCLSLFWDRFETKLYVFDDTLAPKLNYLGSKQRDYNYFKDVISNHAEESELAQGLFYIKDYYKGISYLAQHTFELEGNSFTVFIVFRSKKIPEELGIPRLLINKSANALEDLEDYAIARYSLGNLVMRFGDFNYPTEQEFFLKSSDKKKGFIKEKEFLHYILGQDNQMIVITKSQPSNLKPITNFSYLFLFNGTLILIFYLFSGNWSFRSLFELQLSFKIQFLLIGLVVVAVVVFSIVAGNFVKQQYEVYTNDNLKEKLYAVELELIQKVGERIYIDSENDAPYLNYVLDKLSTVFATDINLYAPEGSLIASSQPILYTKGIVGKAIHPRSFYALKYSYKPEFIHYEKIGNLSYQAAYIPLRNNVGNLLGYLNLQHFAKQTQFEEQINGFIMAIINSAVLLLVITVIIGVFIANKITLPLRLIHTSLKSVELGKENKPIAYEAADEIGVLVRDYNNKLADLELKAIQLAKSERESAWREMAKQVAHEIKNPLTPMKLTLQHFKRSFDPDAPDAQEKINRVARILVEQIDTLTHIANEFSTFAKLPQPNEEVIDLLPYLMDCVDLFKSDNIGFEVESDLEQVIVSADKDLMVRVFNNVLKNAVQAIPDERKGVVKVRVTKDGDVVMIQVKDNGIGIASAEKEKVFVPNFTTKKTGSGLGLAMVKQIIEQHRGEIYFDSKEGVGTTFFVRLPFAT